MASKLDQLRAMTTVVADTGDLGAVARLKPVDYTTKPTTVLSRLHKVEDGRIVLLHTKVPQEPFGLGYGSRLAHGVFEALRRDGKRVIAK